MYLIILISIVDNFIQDCRDGYGRNVLAKSRISSLRVVKLDMFRTSRVVLGDLGCFVKTDVGVQGNIEE